jgi:hypothetical protein
MGPAGIFMYCTHFVFVFRSMQQFVHWFNVLRSVESSYILLPYGGEDSIDLLVIWMTWEASRNRAAFVKAIQYFEIYSGQELWNQRSDTGSGKM